MHGRRLRERVAMASLAASVAPVGAASAQPLFEGFASGPIHGVDRLRVPVEALSLRDEADLPVSPGGMLAQVEFLRGRAVERPGTDREG